MNVQQEASKEDKGHLTYFCISSFAEFIQNASQLQEISQLLHFMQACHSNEVIKLTK